MTLNSDFMSFRKKDLTLLVERYRNDFNQMGKAIIINIKKYDGDLHKERLGSEVTFYLHKSYLILNIFFYFLSRGMLKN